MLPPSFFDGAARPADEPPLPTSEDEYGENVVRLERKKRRKEEWAKEWQLSETGSPLPNLVNALITLRGHPKLEGVVRFDEMARTIAVCRQPPGCEGSVPRFLSDTDVLAIQEEMQRSGLRRMARTTVQDALERHAAQNPFHPVREYLCSLEWDGETRVGGWLSRYLGVEGGPYADAIGQMFLVSMIARIFEPGCQADYMLVFEGPQGEGKSSASSILAAPWFSDSLPDLGRGDAVRLSMHLRGKWLIEIAEMSSFSNAAVHRLKEFLTQKVESYTPKYARNEVHEPRQCVFVGTTNEGAYLRDPTGDRRFWPVKVGMIDKAALAQDRDQLFAEALLLYRDGAQRFPTKEFEREHIAPEQGMRFVEDPWQQEIETWIARENIWRTTVNDVLRGALSVEAGRMGTVEQRRVSAIFQRLGWRQTRSNGKRWLERPKLEG